MKTRDALALIHAFMRVKQAAGGKMTEDTKEAYLAMKTRFRSNYTPGSASEAIRLTTISALEAQTIFLSMFDLEDQDEHPDTFRD